MLEIVQNSWVPLGIREGGGWLRDSGTLEGCFFLSLLHFFLYFALELGRGILCLFLLSIDFPFLNSPLLVYVFPLVVFSLQRARKKKEHNDEGGEGGP